MGLAKLFVAPFLFFTASVSAIVPASEEQLVCSSTSMFHGKVINARSTDCRLHLKAHQVSCEPINTAVITIIIDQIMVGSQSSLHVGDKVEAGTRICNVKALHINHQIFDICSIGNRDLPVRLDGRAIQDEDVTAAFVGKSFYFTMWSNGRQVETLKKPDQSLAIWKEVCPTSPFRQTKD